MVDVLILLCMALTCLFCLRVRLETEIVILRLRRNSPKRFVFGTFDRLMFVGLYCLVPGIVEALAIVRFETAIPWHRAGFRWFWRWKSKRRSGRPSILLDIHRLIQNMSLTNPLSGAPRIRGELLKLGIDVGLTSVAKYISRRRGGPSQDWRTLLSNHAGGVVSMELFVVPKLFFRLLYDLLVLQHLRRRIMLLGVTASPVALNLLDD